jgi:hypothetical protein
MQKSFLSAIYRYIKLCMLALCLFFLLLVVIIIFFHQLAPNSLISIAFLSGSITLPVLFFSSVLLYKLIKRFMPGLNPLLLFIVSLVLVFMVFNISSKYIFSEFLGICIGDCRQYYLNIFAFRCELKLPSDSQWYHIGHDLFSRSIIKMICPLEPSSIKILTPYEL